MSNINTQVVLTNISSKRRKAQMTPSQKRHQEKLERYASARRKNKPKSIQARVLHVINDAKRYGATVNAIRGLVLAEFDTVLKPTQVYSATQRLRKQGLIRQYDSAYYAN